MTRIEKRFARLAAEGRKAFVAYVMAGDPDYDTSLAVLPGLPAAGVDLDRARHAVHRPDGRRPVDPARRAARARAGQTMDRTLAMVRAFRGADADTPIVLMGYYNPIYSRGVAALPRGGEGRGRRRADRRRPAARGGRGALPARAGRRAQLHPPRDADDRRPPAATGADNTSGFVYYVSITGITGAAAANAAAVAPDVARIKARDPLPVCVGFGIRTPEAAGAIAARRRRRGRRPAIVERIAAGDPPAQVLAFVRSLAEAAHAGYAASSVKST